MQKIKPYAYFITYRTYASWLHGDYKGSVHHAAAQIGTPTIPHHETMRLQIQSRLSSKEFILNYEQSKIVLQGIQLACTTYHWRLFAAHVRTDHAHMVIQAPVDPARVITQTKAYATRALRRKTLIQENTKCWAKHGSTKYIWFPEKIYFPMYYVIEQQGRKMACFFEDWFDERFRKEVGATLGYV